MSGGIAATLVAAGMDGALAASIAGTAITGAEIGAGTGFVTDLVEGKGIGQSLIGGLEGGAMGGVTAGTVGGFGPALGGALDIGTTAGSALVGAGVGAAGSAVTGSNPLVGAAEGGVNGAISGYNASSAPAAPTTGAGGAALAAPAGSAPSGDVTLPDATSNAATPVAGPQSANFAGPSSIGSTPESALSGGASGLGGSTPSATSGSVAPTSGFTEPNTTGLVSPSTAPTPNGGGLFSSGDSGTALPSAPSGAGAAAAGAKGPSSISQLFGSGEGQGFTMSNIGSALGANAGLLTSAAGLGNDIVSATRKDPNTAALQKEASQLANLGTQNQGYLNSGTLPAGVQAGLDQATKSAIATVKSKYASMGMSGSSAEQSDIASITTNAQVQGANIAMNLMQQGASETGLSSQIYSELVKNTMASDQNFASAFTNLASAVGGGSGGGTKGTITFG